MMELHVIPNKIDKSLNNRLESYLCLTGLSGSTWKAQMTRNDNTLFLKNWWKEFMDDHALE